MRTNAESGTARRARMGDRRPARRTPAFALLLALILASLLAGSASALPHQGRLQRPRAAPARAVPRMQLLVEPTGTVQPQTAARRRALGAAGLETRTRLPDAPAAARTVRAARRNGGGLDADDRRRGRLRRPDGRIRPRGLQQAVRPARHARAENGCFTKVNQNGQAAPLPTVEQRAGPVRSRSTCRWPTRSARPATSLLVEAKSEEFSDLAEGVNAAVELGATEVSNSYGSTEETGLDRTRVDLLQPPGHRRHRQLRGLRLLNETARRTGRRGRIPGRLPARLAVGGTSVTRKRRRVDEQRLGRRRQRLQHVFNAPFWESGVAGFAATGCGSGRADRRRVRGRRPEHRRGHLHSTRTGRPTAGASGAAPRSPRRSSPPSSRSRAARRASPTRPRRSTGTRAKPRRSTTSEPAKRQMRHGRRSAKRPSASTGRPASAARSGSARSRCPGTPEEHRAADGLRLSRAGRAADRAARRLDRAARRASPTSGNAAASAAELPADPRRDRELLHPGRAKTSATRSACAKAPSTPPAAATKTRRPVGPVASDVPTVTSCQRRERRSRARRSSSKAARSTRPPQVHARQAAGGRSRSSRRCKLEVTVPNGANKGKLTVTTAHGSVKPQDEVRCDVRRSRAFAPLSAAAGATVTIKGVGFTPPPRSASPACPRRASPTCRPRS